MQVLAIRPIRMTWLMRFCLSSRSRSVLAKLLALQCDLGQGYYFAKPLPLEEVDELLTTRQTLETRETELSS